MDDWSNGGNNSGSNCRSHIDSWAIDLQLQVRNVIGSLRIEGLELDTAAQQCLIAMQTQAMSTEQAIEHFKCSIQALHEVQR